jgi:hypothetical protein
MTLEKIPAFAHAKVGPAKFSLMQSEKETEPVLTSVTLWLHRLQRFSQITSLTGRRGCLVPCRNIAFCQLMAHSNEKIGEIRKPIEAINKHLPRLIKSLAAVVGFDP